MNNKGRHTISLMQQRHCRYLLSRVVHSDDLVRPESFCGGGQQCLGVGCPTLAHDGDLPEMRVAFA